MERTISVLIFLSWVISLNCSSSKNGSINPKREAIRKVSIVELTNPAFVKKYENQTVTFTAKFGQISFGFDVAGIGQYRMTHHLISIVSEDGQTKMPYVLVPAYNKVLPSLRAGDLLQVEAEPHIASTSDEDDYVYLLVTEMIKL